MLTHLLRTSSWNKKCGSEQDTKTLFFRRRGARLLERASCAGGDRPSLIYLSQIDLFFVLAAAVVFLWGGKAGGPRGAPVSTTCVVHRKLLAVRGFVDCLLFDGRGARGGGRILICLASWPAVSQRRLQQVNVRRYSHSG